MGGVRDDGGVGGKGGGRGSRGHMVFSKAVLLEGFLLK